MAGGCIMLLVWECGTECWSAGDWPGYLSVLSAAPGGEPANPLLDGRSSVERATPLLSGGGRELLPLTPAATINLCRASASLSTCTPAGTGEFRCCERLSVTFGFGPPSLMRGPAGSSTFSRASTSSDLKWSCILSARRNDVWVATNSAP